MACSNLWVLYALLDRKRKPKVAKLTSKITKKLLAELESGHIETTQQCIRFVFKTCKVLVTAPTMRAHLRAQGLWNYIKQRKPYVTTLDKKRRVEVAKELMRFSDADLNKIVFTDEKEVTQDAPGHKKRVWRPKGAPFNERRSPRGHPHEYVGPSCDHCDRYFGVALLESYFQQDNSGVHTADVVEQFLIAKEARSRAARS
eukprot:m.130253 g.130253  ORF g.130253 m.130253 type:complete len:201 (-) comp9446_c0_seq1:503-1105(-)